MSTREADCVVCPSCSDSGSDSGSASECFPYVYDNLPSIGIRDIKKVDRNAPAEKCRFLNGMTSVDLAAYEAMEKRLFREIDYSSIERRADGVSAVLEHRRTGVVRVVGCVS